MPKFESNTGRPFTIGPVRVSYPTVWEPSKKDLKPEDPSMSVSLMIDKQDKMVMEQLKELLNEMQKIVNLSWPDGLRVPLVGDHDSPIKDADTATNRSRVPLIESNPEYAGHFILRAAQKFAKKREVHLVNRDLSPATENIYYGGCWCKVCVQPYTFNVPTNQGVTFSLKGVQFWKEDEPFGASRMSLEQMFGDAEKEIADAKATPAQDFGGII